MPYHPAKVFRRTGERTYCVQLARDPVTTTPEGLAAASGAITMMPGVIDVQCTSVDWTWNTGHNGRQWQQDMLHALERRLQKIGTRDMFNWGYAQQCRCLVQPIDVSEGVEIMLGPYHPERRAFVRCSLRCDMGKLRMKKDDCDGCTSSGQQGAIVHKKRGISIDDNDGGDGKQKHQSQKPPRKKRRAGLQ